MDLWDSPFSKINVYLVKSFICYVSSNKRDNSSSAFYFPLVFVLIWRSVLLRKVVDAVVHCGINCCCVNGISKTVWMTAGESVAEVLRCRHHMG